MTDWPRHLVRAHLDPPPGEGSSRVGNPPLVRLRAQPFDHFEIARCALFQPPGQEAFYERMAPSGSVVADDEEIVETIITVYGYRHFPEEGCPNNACTFDPACPHHQEGLGLTAISDFTDDDFGLQGARDLAEALANGKQIIDYTKEGE